MVERRRILLITTTPRVPQPIEPGVWQNTDASVTLTNGGLTATKTTTHATAWGCARGSASLKAGQWYWETTVLFTSTADVAVGVAAMAASLAIRPGSDAGGLSIAVARDGAVRAQNVVLGNVGALASGARVRLWLDVDAQLLFVAVGAGAWQLFLMPPGMTGVELRPIVGFLRPVSTTVSATANFGAAPLVGPVPDEAHAGAYNEPASIETTLYLGSEGFAHVPWNDKTNTWDYANSIYFEGRVAADSDVEIEREGSCWVWGNQSTARRGQVTLVNVDGALVAWLDYDWRNASITLLSGFEGDALDAFTVWTQTVVDSVEATPEGRLLLHLADPLAMFDVPVQPNLYPDNQPNPQAVGQPKPIVIGQPLYCEGVLTDVNPTVRDVDLHDNAAGLAGATAGITSITKIYDRGNAFRGPDEIYVPNNPITLGNGGDFVGAGAGGAWVNDAAGVPMPKNWSRVTGFGATNDRFAQGATANTLRMLSGGQMWAAIYHNASSVLTGYRYTISFTVTAVAKAGQVIFRADGPTPDLPFDDAVVAITAPGVVSVTLDVRESAQLQIVLGRTELDVTIDNLTVSSVQIIDWTYRSIGGNRVGFHLTNAAAGKIVSNPVGPSVAGVVVERLTSALNYVLARGWKAAGAAGGAPTVTTSAEVIRSRADYRIATYESKPKTAVALLREIMDSWCGWICARRDGGVTVGWMQEPTRAPVITLDANNILGGIAVADDLAKGLTVRIAGGRNHGVHSDGDLVDGIAPALKAELTTEMTCVRTGAPAISNAPVSAAYTQAIGAPAKATLLQDARDIQSEANRIATLWRPKRRFYTVTARLGASTADALEPGQTAWVIWRRHGLKNGRNLLVIGVRSRFFSRRVDLKLWG